MSDEIIGKYEINKKPKIYEIKYCYNCDMCDVCRLRYLLINSFSDYFELDGKESIGTICKHYGDS